MMKIVVIANMFIIAVFALLAVQFNHWWIVLFAALFLHFPKDD